MFGIPNQADVAKMIQDAPAELFSGASKVFAGIYAKAQAPIIFGENLWNGMTPEQQATLEKALTELLIQGAEMYLASRNKGGA